MARARDNRLARLAEPATHANSVKSVDHCVLRAQAAVCALVGDALAQAGIDPARARALHLIPRPDPLPANEAKEQVDEFAASDDDGLADRFAAKIGDLARRYENGREPDFGNASLAELFAWSLARRPRPEASQPSRPTDDDALNRDAPLAAQKNRSCVK